MADEKKTEAPTKGARREGRSPNYPFLTLEEALNRARTLYDGEGRNEANTDVIKKHWGYKNPASGIASSNYASVRAFGLLEESGAGKQKRARLSKLALSILLDTRPDSQERRKAIQQAALTPPTHKQVWAEYKGALPSDENLRYELTFKKGFTQSGADEFIQQFRKTITYAELRPSDTLTDEDEAESPENEDDMTPPSLDLKPPSDLGKSEVRTYDIPLSPRESALLRLPRRLNERAWKQMLTVLEAMKPGIVADEPPDQDQESDH